MIERLISTITRKDIILFIKKNISQHPLFREKMNGKQKKVKKDKISKYGENDC